ncbi:MAG: Membrane-associated zinc metalloprotease [Candidatus Daviesbacteria bacterium GW2011_GWB1_39_5]|uniref:Membrane-associated zinc metalloprotease n=1 Tax=Candidatus Daviesbacteria bacterium GW2011_GWC2_40_12 TaxID=1618431 RepID=A0A0G0QX41_9BACT|nr:MAG: Membrane-associated zinc metalloprotease [Candidatus Daviesbacteria bacterium GW2011_GWF2_38_7]KKR16197.1 MAG: Membrane-associated zinc metalloprotease [Candidatus Daviesbacteria bacterium GW2011_GWA2_39_33]KKR25064.1 MAG: Membrane-associated zinc metalloprotease [Candidatus Daviesbacteria bacterium GW2011_GWB1_39_5]KKR41976.1 MAG: Membrane-associated zinc metalloprotease [Candidatus Daviesbacteria bacterium GW2011_GWC2_40_12]
MVLIHEFGHFLMAKKFGIKVEEFGFGIPPRIWGKKFGETLYSINWLPIGGFVRLQGEDEEGTLDKNKKDSRDFRAKPVSQRIIVVVAGVIMNLVLAWALFYTVIIAQNFKIIYPVSEPAVYILQVEKDFPAQLAGIKAGEKLLAIDNQQISDIDQARNFIQTKDEKPLTLTLVDIDGKNKREISVTPKKGEDGRALIGVVFSPIPFKQYHTPIEKIFSGITYSYDLTKITFVGFAKLVGDLTTGNFGQASQSVAGPVGLATVTNSILSTGWEAIVPYIWFVGVISLTLAIFNVLPIPALDGGRLLFLVIEAVARKKVKEDVEKMVHQVGFIILIALAILVTFSDIRKLLP